MPTYRGNQGNLLQHWTLCELIASCNKYWTDLRFIDAYSMSPYATERLNPGLSGPLFDKAREEDARSVYQEIWRKLSRPLLGYPNSSAFVAELWRGSFSMLLCENDEQTVKELSEWAIARRTRPECSGIEIWGDDWRRRFESDLVGSEALKVFSFDPDLLKRRGADNGRHISPKDLTIIGAALHASSGPAVIQISTYNVNDANSQEVIEDMVASELQKADFDLLAILKTDGQMMSLVFGRFAEPIVTDMGRLSQRFDAWFAAFQRETRGGRSPSGLPPLPRMRRRL